MHNVEWFVGTRSRNLTCGTICCIVAATIVPARLYRDSEMSKVTHVLPQDREPCLCTTFRTLARKATAMYDEHLNGTGLTLPQYSLLSRLDGLGSCSLSELADATELDITSTSRSVRVLIDAGLIELSQGRDARKKSHRLSREGKRRLKKAYPAWLESQKALSELLSAHQPSGLKQVADAIAAYARRPS
jgi:DNA-binding MarR family transcriptional regulator